MRIRNKQSSIRKLVKMASGGNMKAAKKILTARYDKRKEVAPDYDYGRLSVDEIKELTRINRKARGLV